VLATVSASTAANKPIISGLGELCEGKTFICDPALNLECNKQKCIAKEVAPTFPTAKPTEPFRSALGEYCEGKLLCDSKYVCIARVCRDPTVKADVPLVKSPQVDFTVAKGEYCEGPLKCGKSLKCVKQICKEA
jgi:hypothetical protein